MIVSETASNAADLVRRYPIPAAGLAALAVGFAVWRNRDRSGDIEPETNPLPDSADYVGDGAGITPFPESPSGSVTPPIQTPILGKPGPIASQAMRISEADRAAYSCPDGMYLRYGRGENVNKIVCVVRDGPSKGRERAVIVKQR